MIKLMRRVNYFLNARIEPLILLGIRFYMWKIFFTSGKSKLDNYFNDDWESTLFLFEDVHPVPFIPPEIAAIMGTAGEVVLSCMLLLGLFGRFTGFGLLCMVAVIEFSFQHNTAMHPDYVTIPEHIMWALLLGMITVRGSGGISLDYFLRKKVGL